MTVSKLTKLVTKLTNLVSKRAELVKKRLASYIEPCYRTAFCTIVKTLGNGKLDNCL